jgi:methyl-accepting chemotaxis protein
MFRKSAPLSLETRLAQAIFAHSPDGMALIQNGVFTACNDAAATLYDRTRDQIIGRTPVDFSAATQADGRPSGAHVQEKLQKAQTEGFARFEWLNIDRHGQPVRLMVTLLPAPIDSGQDVIVLLQSMAEVATVVDQLGQGLQELSQGNLACHLTQPFRADYEGLRHSFNRTVDAMAASMDKVLMTAHQVSAGADEIERAAHDLSQRTEQQAMKVESTVAALHDVSQAMVNTSQAATRANQLVGEAQRRASTSSDVVLRTVDAMAAIETSSHEISDIVSVIDGIAFQTNLLALNAGVEAARAGDAGRGFAVVASEVRALAQRSADAAKDIKTRIQGSAAQVGNGVALVKETGTALTRIAEGIAEISTVMSTIATDAQDQTTRLQDVNSAVQQIDTITQSNAAMSEEASAAARGLAQQSSSLMQELAHFRRSAPRAHQTLRAA